MIMESSKPHSADNRSADEERYFRARMKMVEEIREMAYDASDYVSGPISEKVLAIMTQVPRHRFVPEDELYSAYYNNPLPIGHGQTISQPYIVALMTDLLKLDKQQTVLEVGTGSGYQAAVLSELAGKVYSIEIVAPLATAAAKLLGELGCENVEVRAGDGSGGLPEHAPYDGIIVTAAAEPHRLSEAVKRRVADGGQA